MGNSLTNNAHHKRSSNHHHNHKRSSLQIPQISSLSLPTSYHSARSVTSAITQNTQYSQISTQSRPWSKISRRPWHDSTLTNPLKASKTAWPVSQTEAMFLPEFSIQSSIKHNSNFDIKEFIARGSYGKVYRALKKDTQEIFAIKILNKYQIVKEDLISQVKAEVKIQSMCGHHPFIVNAPFFWQDRKQIYVVSQYYEGGDLFDLVKMYSPFPESVVQIYIAEIALAIDFLHNAGVIYRDVKAENILLDSEGHAHLTDFGMAKWLPLGSRTSTMCGTKKYMAPEVGHVESYNHSVDWWSLGVLAHVMLSAKFPGDNGALRLDPNTSSKAIRNLISRLLAKDPRMRLRSLMTLEIDPFFKGFKFSDVRSKKISPKKLLENNIIHKKGPDKLINENENKTNAKNDIGSNEKYDIKLNGHNIGSNEKYDIKLNGHRIESNDIILHEHFNNCNDVIDIKSVEHDIKSIPEYNEKCFDGF